MGSIGKSVNTNSSSTMTFEEAEYYWAVNFPNKNDPQYNAMKNALDKEIENSNFNGTAYRGLNIESLNNEEQILEKFKPGSIITNENNRDFVSWSTNLDGAAGFAYDGTNLRTDDGLRVAVLLRSVDGIKNSVELPNTKLIMSELLTKGSNTYTVEKISTRVLDDWGIKAYIVDVKQNK